ncbi:MAG TPA: ArdC-like ssDNA-binding domain-containing protein, partial [Tepidisphaeraceae bacterium]|nr:ArdC-like ssDNA-binding domain-containing protein [Tepidisphaeraceae bacterium]
MIDAVNKPGLVSSAYQLFWRYSVGNQILALFQCLLRKIEPGPIHTYRGWLKLGRQVRKGEKAITLVMPVQIKRKRYEPLPDGAIADNDSSAGHCVNAGDVTFTKFIERPFWFVLSQTDGEPVKPDTVSTWDESDALSVLNIARVRFCQTDGNCQGYANGRQVAVSPIAFMPHRTLFHELAHVELGHTAESLGLVDHGETTPRDIREVEAECVALICSAALGLPGEEF